MRFKVILTPVTKSILIKWDYQQCLAAFIYNCLNKADPAYSRFLHDGEQRVDNKPIKPFVFSWLNFPSGVRLTPDGLVPNMGLVEFFIASPDLQFVQTLVNGLYGSTVSLGLESVYGVRAVEIQPVPSFTDSCLSIRTMSPVVAPWIENPKDKGKQQYKKIFLKPEDPRFISVLLKNLSRKHVLFHNQSISENSSVKIDLDYKNSKSKLVRYRGGAIKAFNFRARINAPGELLSLIYEAGLGSYNSQGFGMVEAVGL